MPFIRTNVSDDATIYTDEHNAYNSLRWDGYKHASVNHQKQYVVGRVHTNGIENFWSLLMRGLLGTYVSVQPGHLFRYVDERMFTFNNRGDNDFGRFRAVLRHVAGRRLTWAELTA